MHLTSNLAIFRLVPSRDPKDLDPKDLDLSPNPQNRLIIRKEIAILTLFIPVDPNFLTIMILDHENLLKQTHLQTLTAILILYLPINPHFLTFIHPSPLLCSIARRGV